MPPSPATDTSWYLPSMRLPAGSTQRVSHSEPQRSMAEEILRDPPAVLEAADARPLEAPPEHVALVARRQLGAPVLAHERPVAFRHRRVEHLEHGATRYVAPAVVAVVIHAAQRGRAVVEDVEVVHEVAGELRYRSFRVDVAFVVVEAHDHRASTHRARELAEARDLVVGG